MNTCPRRRGGAGLLALAVSAAGLAGCLAVELRLHPDAGPLGRQAADCPPSLDSPTAFLRPWCRGHIGNPPHPERKHVKVLAFGDSWAEFGPSHGMLQDMFARHGVNARVEVVANTDSHACDWAQDEEILVKALDKMFNGETVDYVWITLGGNDYKRPKYKKCVAASETRAGVTKCHDDFTTKHVNPCIDSMLTAMWGTERYANVRVVQCGYDFPCAHPICLLNPVTIHFPECEDQFLCKREQMVRWQETLLQEQYHNFKGHGDKYTGISVLGALQSSDQKAYGPAAAGEPNMGAGSPCSQTLVCVHPRAGTPGAAAVGEAFWSKYFEHEDVVKQVLEEERAALNETGD